MLEGTCNSDGHIILGFILVMAFYTNLPIDNNLLLQLVHLRYYDYLFA